MRTGVSPKRIATGNVKLFVSRMAMRFAYAPPEIWSCCPSMRRPPLTLIDASHQWALGRSPDGWIHFHASIHASVSVCLPMSSAAWTPWQLDSNTTPTSSFSLERRWSSRTFRYGYLVTTSPQLPVLPSAALSFMVESLTSGITDSHGVTGGVYKTRERIHRSILICDY